MNAHVRNCASGMIAFAAASAAFPVCAFADEGAGINAILPQMEEFIPMLVAFIILWIVLAKFGWPLFEGMLNKREETIKNSLEKSEEARQESERLLAEYREQLEGAKTQAQQILNNAKLTGDALEKEITAKAQAEADACRQGSCANRAGEGNSHQGASGYHGRYFYCRCISPDR